MGYFKDGLLSGRNAFISGGTSGINLAIAEALMDAGATVGVMSRKPEKVEAALALLLPKGKAFGYSADVRNFDAVSNAMEQFYQAAGPIDIVISGAAGNFVAPANGLSSNGFKTVLEIDLLGSFHVYRGAYPYLRKPGASLISISAPQATETSFGQSHVAAAKAGVDMLTKSLAVEWGPEGIRANCIIPGPIDGTEGMDRLTPNLAFRRHLEDSVALRRFGTKQEVAAMAVFLASDAASYVTGSLMYCDGGMTLSMGGAMSPAAFSQFMKSP